MRWPQDMADSCTWDDLQIQGVHANDTASKYE